MNIRKLIREALENIDIIAYHISENKFDKFDSSKEIGNYGTVLDGSYFLSTIDEISNFGNLGFIYKVAIKPTQLFRFNLDDEGLVSTEFQQLFCEQLAGMDNVLSLYIEEQDINDIYNIDCIELSNLEYTGNKSILEYIVLNDEIITILDRKEL